MTKKIIDKYIAELNRLRKVPLKFVNYSFILDPLTNKDINQEKRHLLGIAFFNDLDLLKDYNLIKRLLQEEIKCRKANTSNYNGDVIHMYFYFLSQFKVIEDIWLFAQFKYSGTTNEEFTFETGFFLSYGIIELESYLDSTKHPLKDKIYNSVFNDSGYSNIDGIIYQKTQIKYFGFKSPIKDPLEFYQKLGEKTLFAKEYQKWKYENDITDPQIAYDNIQYAVYLGDEKLKEQAILNYYFSVPDGYLANEYLKELSSRTKILIFLRDLRKNMMNRKYIASTLMTTNN